MELKREYFIDPKEMGDDLLIEALTASFTPEEVPACRVCGGKLSVASAGGGHATVWACSGMLEEQQGWKPGRKFADEHYDRSRWTQYQSGNVWVLELIQRFQNLKK